MISVKQPAFPNELRADLIYIGVESEFFDDTVVPIIEKGGFVYDEFFDAWALGETEPYKSVVSWAYTPGATTETSYGEVDILVDESV